jgi:putative FmdB family regulatory protein
VPIYDYQCEPQGHRFEVRHGINESPVQACPECGGPVRRIIHPVGIVFKGSGFYATDSRSGSSAKQPKAEAAGETKSETKPDSSKKPAAESKSESAGS